MYWKIGRKGCLKENGGSAYDDLQGNARRRDYLLANKLHPCNWLEGVSKRARGHRGAPLGSPGLFLFSRLHLRGLMVYEGGALPFLFSGQFTRFSHLFPPRPPAAAKKPDQFPHGAVNLISSTVNSEARIQNLDDLFPSLPFLFIGKSSVLLCVKASSACLPPPKEFEPSP